jgi:CubicO group peptidase (beta-lactamase class C family)
MPTRRVFTAVAVTSFALAALAQERSPQADRLLRLAQESGSDALYVTVDRKPVIDWARGEKKPIELMSALKSLVAIAIGRLLHDGALKSLDEPVHTFYPEWKQGRKASITVRHLLNHTSGLQNVPNAGAEIYPSPNGIQLALAAELTSDPGAEFSYNNKAVNLLAGIIERASGLRMDLYFGEKIFAPMGISDYQWYFDKSGQPHAMAGLRLRASDAAKFGQLVLDDGMFGSERLMPAGYAAQLVAPSQTKYPLAGLLWWRYSENQLIRLKGELPPISDATVRAKLGAIAGQQFHSRAEMRTTLQRELGASYESIMEQAVGRQWFDVLFDWSPGETIAYYAEGYLGQYIVIVPESHVVAVRQIASRPDLGPETTFSNFQAEVVAFARKAKPAAVDSSGIKSSPLP